MKLPTILRTETASKLETARADVAAAEDRIERLSADRTAALANDDIGTARKLDVQLSELRAARATYADRVGLLQTKLQREQREQRAADYQTAVDRIEADLLPPRTAAAAELEAALKAVAVAARKLKEAGDAVRKNWPANVPQPSNYFLGMDRVGERIKACFQPGLLVRKYTRKRPSDTNSPKRLSRSIVAPMALRRRKRNSTSGS